MQQEINNQDEIAALLLKKECSRSIKYFPNFKPLDHTMGFSLQKYVQQKLPLENLHKAIMNQWKIEVHGIYPTFFEDVAQHIGFDLIEPIEFEHNSKIKKLNYIRPRFFIGYKIGKKNTLGIAVTPGEDYIYHYAGMLRYYISSVTAKSHRLLEIVRYPELEASIAEWTGLDRSFVKKGDFLVLGFIQEILKELKSHLSMTLVETKENDYYLSYRFILESGQTVNFLGVKYSFWGNISTKLVERLCELGASKIAYIGKLGCMTNPADLYDRIFSPTKFLHLKANKMVGFATKVDNELVNAFPELNSGWHVSVPTVIEEDYSQRKVSSNFECSSIDNEISQMAIAIDKYNNTNKGTEKIPFLPLHFATDYLRNDYEKTKHLALDLSTNRTSSAEEKKSAIFKKLSGYFTQYIENQKELSK